LQTNDVELRFAWAQTALKFHDPQNAAQALSGVDDRFKSTATFHKLAGALAWEVHDAAAAETHYRAALQLEPGNESIVLNLATVRLSSTNKTEEAAARQALEQIPEKSPLRPTALRYLAADAASRKAFSRAISFSTELLKNSAVTFADEIAHVELLRQARDANYRPYRATVETEARQSPGQVYAFAQWLALTEGPTNTVSWIHSLPAALQTNQPVPLMLVDCQIALENWTDVRDLTETVDWGEADYYRYAVESLADRHLDDTMAARNAWQKSLRLAEHRLDRLARLNQTVARWGWHAERNDLLQAIVAEFPKEKWAVDQLMVSLYADGNTRALAELLNRLYAIYPSDNQLKNNLANICLLRKSDLDKAHRMAQEAYNSAPNNPFFISTYAYSLLLQKKSAEAVKILGGLKTEYLRIPSVAAYYGVVEAEAGHADAARGPLRLAENSHLLPEEKEIVHLASARL